MNLPRPDRTQYPATLLIPTDEERGIIDRRLPGRQAWQRDEHHLQRHIITRLRLLEGTHPQLARILSVPNGGHRNKVAAAKMKAEGQKPGVPDLLLPVPINGHPGLWLELKKAGGTPSPAQWDWLTFLHRHGYVAHVANCPDVAVKLLTTYLEP
jgi:hypothetical protein